MLLTTPSEKDIAGTKTNMLISLQAEAISLCATAEYRLLWGDQWTAYFDSNKFARC